MKEGICSEKSVFFKRHSWRFITEVSNCWSSKVLTKCFSYKETTGLLMSSEVKQSKDSCKNSYALTYLLHFCFSSPLKKSC